MPWRFLRTASKQVLKRQCPLDVTGIEHVPVTGPALIVARHYHHLYDGSALLAAVPRPVRLVVTLDWLERPIGRKAMEIATGSAKWPVVTRTSLAGDAPRSDALATNRAAFRQMIEMLKSGELLAIFPEGYPTIDPTFTPKTKDDEILPFQRGFARLAAAAQREGIRVPVVPAGFVYRREPTWSAQLRFGPARYIDPDCGSTALHDLIESDVRELSGLG